MKFVLSHTYGDSLSWSSDITFPIEYESAEALIVDFEKAARHAFSYNLLIFVFANHEFITEYFFVSRHPGPNEKSGDYICPEIMTIDEWFAINNQIEI